MEIEPADCLPFLEPIHLKYPLVRYGGTIAAAPELWSLPALSDDSGKVSREFKRYVWVAKDMPSARSRGSLLATNQKAVAKALCAVWCEYCITERFNILFAVDPL